MQTDGHTHLPGWAGTAQRTQHLGFVATKPMQVLTAINVWEQLGAPQATLCVTPTFMDAKGVVGRLAERSSGFMSVVQARSRAAAVVGLAYHGAARVFIDSDVGLKTPFAMWLARRLNAGVRFSLYEEGTGLKEIPPEHIPNRLLRTFGATSAFGESRLMEEVWTYDSQAVGARLPHRPMRQIARGLDDFVRSRRAMLLDIFWPAFEEHAAHWHGTKCCVYLSSWEVEPRVSGYLSSLDAFTLWKLHPHIKRSAGPVPGVDQEVQAVVPAELLIIELADFFDEVVVVHHGTAVEQYVKSANVRFVPVEDVLPE